MPEVFRWLRTKTVVRSQRYRFVKNIEIATEVGLRFMEESAFRPKEFLKRAHFFEKMIEGLKRKSERMAEKRLAESTLTSRYAEIAQKTLYSGRPNRQAIRSIEKQVSVVAMRRAHDKASFSTRRLEGVVPGP